MNSEAVTVLIAKTPSLKAAKPKLEAMEPGAYVVHRSWGFGQIKSYDDAAGKLIIDFKGKKSHAMDPAFCIVTMEVLPENHLLVRKACVRRRFPLKTRFWSSLTGPVRRAAASLSPRI
jgi:hypothetical protein